MYAWDAESKKVSLVGGSQINSVSTLIADNNGSLWIGSGVKLMRYRLKEKDILHYAKNDGVQPNEYLAKPRLLTSAGDVYLGGVFGFVHIDRNVPTADDELISVELLDIRLDGSMFPSQKIRMKNGVRHIRIPWKNSSLNLNLLLNTKDLSKKKQYRYILSGSSKSYQPIERNSIDFSRLPTGRYMLKVQYELDSEQWSEPIDLLGIRVLPAWWASWWFLSLLFLSIIVVLWRLRQMAINKTKRAMELEMQRRERNLSEEKVRFLINVSHELRTPLTLVYAPLQRLLNSENISENVNNQLNSMFKHVRNMKNTIDMVLDVRKMEKTRSTLILKKQNVNEWLQKMAEGFQLELSVKHIDLIFDLDDKIKALNFDEEKGEKIILNLLMNAIKFSDEHSKITVQSRHDGEKVYIAVMDEGSGVPEEEAKHLFTRFYQGAHEKGGTGIGLSYAKSLVEAHGGNIGYKPNSPKGSVFWFELPYQPELQADSGTVIEFAKANDKYEHVKPAVDADFTPLKQLSILIAEDEVELLNYLKDALKPYFKRVIGTSNGKDALLQTKMEQPDFIVSDVMMPEMNGFELCRAVKTDVEISHIPVALLSALGDDENKLTGYKVGADIYLSKPFGIEMLLNVLMNMMNARAELKKHYGSVDGSSVTVKELTFSNADEVFLSKFIALIEENMDEPDRNIDLYAGEMAMSRASFYNKVKAVTGMSANNFIIDFKIKKAITLLADNSLTINDISGEIGFVNQRYFSTVFKQITGKTPTQFRKEM